MRRGYRALGAMTVVAALLAATAPAASATAKDPRLAAVKDFAFGLGSGNLLGDVNARFAGYDLVFVDGQEATPEQIAGLRAQGSIVMGYLSVGTIEPYRPWFKRVKKFALPQKFEEFDEFYSNLNAAGFRRQIVRIGRGMLRKGFDGLFLDNTDMIQIFRKQRRGMKKLARALSRLTHSQGRYLFAQNGGDVITPMLRFYDGWNREDPTWSYNFENKTYFRLPADESARALAELARIGAAGLLTLATDYTAGDLAAQNESVANACSVGAIPFVSNIELTRLPAAPLNCP